MRMTEMIAEAVDREIGLDGAELPDFKKLLAEAVSAARKARLALAEERWLALGLHLAATLRRARKGETLPPVDETVLKQVDAGMQELSRQVLGAVSATHKYTDDATEVLLLAVHFAAAKEINQ